MMCNRMNTLCEFSLVGRYSNPETCTQGDQHQLLQSYTRLSTSRLCSKVLLETLISVQVLKLARKKKELPHQRKDTIVVPIHKKLVKLSVAIIEA